MIEASGEERINANKKIRRYKKEIKRIIYKKEDLLLRKLGNIAISIMFFVLTWSAASMMVSMLNSIGISLATAGLVSLYTKFMNNKEARASIKLLFASLSEEEQKKYDEIIEEAKTLSKVNNSKKVKRFIKTYEVKKPYYSVEDVKALLVASASEFYKEKNLFTNQQEIEKPLSSERIDDKEENLKINLTRNELEQLLNGETILLQEPIEIKMKEDIYSSLNKDDNALKDNSRKNRQKVKSRFNKN